MKRFGIPVLLCITYVTLLLLVFSSDLGRSQTSFFPEPLDAREEMTVSIPAPSPVESEQINPEKAALNSGEAESPRSNGSHPESSDGEH